MVHKEPSHQDIQELLGAFALDATDAHEAALVRAHLGDCPRCRAEVAELRTAAAALAYAGTDAPDGLWDKIASALDEAPPPLRLVAAEGPRARRSRMLRVVAMAAAVAVLLGVSVTAFVRAGHRDRVASSTLDGAVIAALTNPKATQVHLSSTSQRYSADVVLLPDGTAYLARNNLPALSNDRTYQLWGQVGNLKVSLGLLGNHPGKAAFVAKAKLVAIAITDEVGGGVVQPSSAPVVAGLVTS